MLAGGIIHKHHMFYIYASEVLSKLVTGNARLLSVSNNFSPSIAQKAIEIKLTFRVAGKDKVVECKYIISLCKKFVQILIAQMRDILIELA